MPHPTVADLARRHSPLPRATPSAAEHDTCLRHSRCGQVVRLLPPNQELHSAASHADSRPSSRALGWAVAPAGADATESGSGQLIRPPSAHETSGSDATGQVRYRLHDLIRIFARERAETEETSRARRSTVRRAIQARVAAAEHLAVHFDENGFGLIHGDPPCAPPRRTPLDPPGVDPTAWLEAELGALVAAVEQAAREGMPDLAWHLAGSLVDFFELRGHLTDWQRTHTAALQATTMAGDTVGTAVILQGLAFLEMARDHYEPALAHLDRAAELFGSADVLVGEVNCAAGAAVCHRLVGRLDQAAACAHQADALAEEAGYLLGQAHARYELGVVLREQGDLAGAADCLEQALAVARKGRYPRAEGIVLRGLGILYARRGDGERSMPATRMSNCGTGGTSGCSGARICTSPTGRWQRPRSAVSSTPSRGRTSTRPWPPWTPSAVTRPPSTACTRRPRRFWPLSTGSGTAWSATATSPTSPWTTTLQSGRFATPWSAGRTTTAATPSGRRIWQPASGRPRTSGLPDRIPPGLRHSGRQGTRRPGPSTIPALAARSQRHRRKPRRQPHVGRNLPAGPAP